MLSNHLTYIRYVLYALDFVWCRSARAKRIMNMSDEEWTTFVTSIKTLVKTLWKLTVDTHGENRVPESEKRRYEMHYERVFGERIEL